MKFTYIAQLAVFLHFTVLTFACYAQEPPEDSGVQQTTVPSDVDVVSIDLTGEGLTNGFGNLEVTAAYSASLAIDEPDSTVTTTLAISSEDLDENGNPEYYFQMTYSFVIHDGETHTWTLDSPTCNTEESGGYDGRTQITGCDDADEGEDYVLLFD